MTALGTRALELLAVAANGLRRGHELTGVTVLIGHDHAVRIIADSDWPLCSLQREYGAVEAYRVTPDERGISVEGRNLSGQVQFRRDITAAGQCQPEDPLLFPRSGPLLLTASRALLTGSVSA